MTKSHNYDQISQFLPDFTIFMEFHNFGKYSQLPRFSSSKLWQNFTVFTKFQLQGNTYNADNTGNADYTNDMVNAKNVYNADNLDK